MIEAFATIKTVLGWVGWLGIGLIPALACAAVVFVFPPLRTLAVAAGAAWLIAFSAYTLGDSNGEDRGAARVRDEWSEGVREAGKQGARARQSAEQENHPLEPEPDAPVPVPAAAPGPAAACPQAPAPRCASPPRARNDGVLRSDPNNRNGGKR